MVFAGLKKESERKGKSSRISFYFCLFVCRYASPLFLFFFYPLAPVDLIAYLKEATA
jgi:hypothetical protein